MNTRVSKKRVTLFGRVVADGAVLRGNVFNQHSQVVNVFLEAAQANELPRFVIGNQVDWVAQKAVCAFEPDSGRSGVPLSLLTRQGTDHLLGLHAGGFAWLGKQGIGPIHDTGISWRQEVGH